MEAHWTALFSFSFLDIGELPAWSLSSPVLSLLQERLLTLLTLPSVWVFCPLGLLSYHVYISVTCEFMF